MASLADHLQSILLFGFLCISIVGQSTQSPITACPSFDCGNGITIGYPFWHQSQQLDHCGYPGFNLSCNDQKPTLYLSSNLYHVKNINYSSKSMLLAYPEFKEANCPKLDRDVTLSTTASLFSAIPGNKMIHFFYDCSLYPPSIPHIACLEYGAMRSYVFMEGAIPEFDWHKYCESTVAVPVIDDEAVDGDHLVQGFGKALQDGFKLTWQQPADGECQSCEATGGFCGYGNGLLKNFFCLCSDGRHSINCHDDKGVVSIGLQPNYVATGALIFGGLVIAATIFYVFQKKKVGSYKPI